MGGEGHKPGRICVMCVGNILMLDDGLGPEVARRLIERYEFPEGVSVEDCATMGLALVGRFRDYDLVLCVDSVDGTGLEPGTLVRFSPDDIAPRIAFPTAHGTTFWDVVSSARMLGYTGEGECIGVQVECMDPPGCRIGLTPKVEASLPNVMDAVISLLVSRGVRGIVDRESGEEVTPR